MVAHSGGVGSPQTIVSFREETLPGDGSLALNEYSLAQSLSALESFTLLQLLWFATTTPCGSEQDINVVVQRVTVIESSNAPDSTHSESAALSVYRICVGQWAPMRGHVG